VGSTSKPIAFDQHADQASNYVNFNQGCGSWKRLNFCGSRSTIKKEARSKLGSD